MIWTTAVSDFYHLLIEGEKGKKGQWRGENDNQRAAYRQKGGSKKVQGERGCEGGGGQRHRERE